MQREEMLAKVEAAYQARRTGDIPALDVVVAEGAAFSFAGEQSLLSRLPGSGDVGVHQAAAELHDSIELLSSIGSSPWRKEIASRSCGAPRSPQSKESRSKRNSSTCGSSTTAAGSARARNFSTPPSSSRSCGKANHGRETQQLQRSYARARESPALSSSAIGSPLPPSACTASTEAPVGSGWAV